MPDEFEMIRKSSELGQLAHWREWAKDIPFIHFGPGVLVKPIPPFAGALVRFLVQAKGKTISVYLDGYDVLGCVGKPYWEAYCIDGDTARFYLDETENLVAAIRKELFDNDGQ